MGEFELRARIVENGDNYDGVVVKISDGNVWIKFDVSGDVVEVPIEDVQIIYPELEVVNV